MSAPDPSSQALVVGVSQYRHLGKLRETRGASGTRNVLASPEYCAYPPARVTLLEDDQATRDNIMSALKQLCQSARQDGSRTFFYFTGHGGEGPDGASYILPVDARKGAYPSTAISAGELSRLLDPCRGELTVVLDCCRAAGMAGRDVKTEPAAPGDSDLPDIELGAFTDSLGDAIRPRDVPDKRSTRRVLYAASRGRAYTPPDAPYSLFTGHMLDCLRGADAESTRGANVTVDQLFAYVEKHVRRDSGGAQKPLFISETESFYELTDYPRPFTPKVEFERDVFISFHRDDLELEDWVNNFFRLDLEHNGISIWDYDDIAAGKLSVAEPVVKCRYFIMILTRAYFERPLQEFTAALAVIQAIETRTRRFIPVFREQFSLPLEFGYFTPLDMTPRREMQFRRDMDRLIKRLKKQPNER